MPIKCLNCYDRFEDLPAYLRHNSTHAIDHGCTFYHPSKEVVPV